MRKSFTVLLVLTTGVSFCNGQDSLISNGNVRIGLIAMAGRSIFATNTLPSQTRYPTPEYRLGMSFYYSIAAKMEIQARPAFGMKMNGETQNVLTPFNFLEESTKNRYTFIEVPVMINYYFGKK